MAMTPDEVRQAALALSSAFEGSHHGHPDFRVPNGIFATLRPDKGTSVLRLPPDVAEALVRQDADAFEVVSSGGTMDWLGVTLERVEAEQFLPLLEIAHAMRT